MIVKVPLLKMPPYPLVAVLSVMVLSVTVKVPLLKIPPASPAPFAVMVLLVSVSVPLLKMPPPRLTLNPACRSP